MDAATEAHGPIVEAVLHTVAKTTMTVEVPSAYGYVILTAGVVAEHHAQRPSDATSCSENPCRHGRGRSTACSAATSTFASRSAHVPTAGAARWHQIPLRISTPCRRNLRAARQGRRRRGRFQPRASREVVVMPTSAAAAVGRRQGVVTPASSSSFNFVGVLLLVGELARRVREPPPRQTRARRRDPTRTARAPRSRSRRHRAARRSRRRVDGGSPGACTEAARTRAVRSRDSIPTLSTMPAASAAIAVHAHGDANVRSRGRCRR